MTLVRFRRSSQITLPAEVKDKLKLKEGDYLEVEVVEGGALLKPVSSRVGTNWQEFAERVKPTSEQAEKPLDQQEAEIAEEVEAFRHRHG